MRRLVCLLRGHAWRCVTDHADYVLVSCTRCGALPVWYAPEDAS